MSVAAQTRQPAAKTPVTPAPQGLLHRKCACGGKVGVDGMCDKCRETRLARKRDESAHDPHAVPPIVHDVLRSPGEPLDPSTRTFMESRFGYDFGRVRVHTDAQAAESAKAVDAVAYAAGADIVFSRGAYLPHHPEGRQLLAHELAHVVQHGPSAGAVPARVVGPHERSEAEAHRAATLATSEGERGSRLPLSVASRGADALHRWHELSPTFLWRVKSIAGSLWCLDKVYDASRVATFGAINHNSVGGFRLEAFARAHGPVSNNLWDAFGHCYMGCAGAQQCGEEPAEFASREYESYREEQRVAKVRDHDSFSQDTNNEAFGRRLARQDPEVDCAAACQRAAFTEASMLDLTAPKATWWTPKRGEYTP